jgi:hypothetical protein
MHSPRLWLLAFIHSHDGDERKGNDTRKREEEEGLIGTSKGRKRNRQKKKKMRKRREDTHRFHLSFQALEEVGSLRALALRGREREG